MNSIRCKETSPKTVFEKTLDTKIYTMIGRNSVLNESLPQEGFHGAIAVFPSPRSKEGSTMEVEVDDEHGPA